MKGESTREKVKLLVEVGTPPRRIAAALDLTTQAVYWHITRLRRDGELPPPSNGQKRST